MPEITALMKAELGFRSVLSLSSSGVWIFEHEYWILLESHTLFEISLPVRDVETHARYGSFQLLTLG